MKLLIHKPKVSLLFALFTFICTLANAQINVFPNQTYTALAQKLAGPGITVMNATGSCYAYGNGFFTVTSSNLGLDSGIVLTTGVAQTGNPGGNGVNGSAGLLASYSTPFGGDPQLQSALNITSSTTDACSLEFDLIPKGDSIKFDYVFGSEEYTSAVCGPYNDGFAFFISGPGISTPQNIALVPGSTIPVMINTINNGIPGSSGGNIVNCTSLGSGSPFTSYYVDNASGATVTYRGFTKVLTAAHSVSPCSTYHMKLVIADVANKLYDSGVFIKGGSLKSTTFSSSSSGLTGGGTAIPYIVKGCAPGTITIKASQAKSTTQVIKYQIGGTAINGVDYAQIPDSVVIPANDSLGVINISGLLTTPQGQKSLTIYFISPYSCNGPEIIDSASLLIEDGLQVAIETKDTIVCEATSFPVKVDGSNNYVYSWQPSAGLSNPNIKEPTVQAITDVDYQLTSVLAGSGCPPAIDTFKVRVVPPPTVEAGADQSVCEGESFTLTATVGPVDFQYWRTWKAPSGNGPSGYSADEITVNNAQTSFSGYYVITATSDVCASVSDSLLVTVKPNPAPPSIVSPVDLCLHQVPFTPLVSGTDNYRWYTTETGGIGDTLQPAAPVGALGTYNYYLSVVRNGCEGDRTELVVNVEKCCADNFFMADAFTPNGDGVNDRLHIIKGMEDRISQFEIFNRWGQLVYSGVDDKGWDGRHNGTPLEAGTYYYQITIGCEKGNQLQILKKGSVTLVR